MPSNTRAKGKRLVRLAKALFESKGAWVESAPLQSKFIGGGKVANLAGDYFGCWDLIVVWTDGRRGFVQVTTWNHITDRRKKIYNKEFPCTKEDYLLGYLDGERTFRVLFGPDFPTAHSEHWPIAEEEVTIMDDTADIIRCAEC